MKKLFLVLLLAITVMLQGCMFGGEVVNEVSRTMHYSGAGEYEVNITYDNGSFCTEFHSKEPMVVMCGRKGHGYEVKYDFGNNKGWVRAWN